MLKRIVLLLFIANYSPVIAQAPRSYTSSEILLQLKKLNTVGSVLYIAAHPDDENTRLIAYLANEKCLRTGYLSLTRGDGGQNLIGPEQGIELGVIRTQELLAARRIDGGEQFFTRAYDFGFSKSPEETLRKWNKDSILSDMVWVIRNFRPDVIITRFATDGSGGHGHHTTSAILAEEAFDAAADPTKFPEQLKYVDVWKTRRMFYNSAARFFNPNADMSKFLKLDVGGYNPLLGKSYGEIAAESRSMHKSQGFGSARQRGESFEYFKPIKGDTTGLKDIFDGIDFTWKRVKGFEKIEGMVQKIMKDYKVEKPEESLESLMRLRVALYGPAESYLMNHTVEALEAHRNDLTSVIETRNKLFHTQLKKLSLLDDIIGSSAGIVFDATADAYNTAQGGKANLSLSLISRRANNIKLSFLNYGSGVDSTCILSLVANKEYKFTKSIALNRPYHSSAHYWLQQPKSDGMFNVPLVNIGLPQNDWHEDKATVTLTINGISVSVSKNIQYRWVDPEKGELYRPSVLTPPVMMNMIGTVATFKEEGYKEIKITLQAGKDNVTGKIKVKLPPQWNIMNQGRYLVPSRNNEKVSNETTSDFSFVKKGETRTISFFVNPLNEASNTTLQFVAEVDGNEYTKGIKEIKYDHIPVQTLFPEAEVKFVKLDVKTKSKRIGYIPGAGDEVAPSLSQLGYEVITLTDEMLAKESLSQYDAIVTGVRAYNTNEKLASFKPKLMEYVNNGGNLIVQYNTNSFAGPFKADIGPYPFKITRDRITDEEAKVVMELPNHPVFNTPNKITEKDFDGWIQERSIYHGGDWDSNYVAPISMSDPNEKPSKGALLIGKYGKGNFIYTGLVFFRELPAGVPGAYRLMVNLIELGK
jgi:LmbE family N-acetylglucosaminyl deacetylase